MVSRRYVVRWGIRFVVLGALIYGVHLWQTWSVPRGQAPVFHADSLGGEPLSPAAYRGQPVLVHFWATWCPICDFVDTSVESVSADYPVITVALQSGSRDQVARHLDDKGLSFPVVNDPSGAIADAYGVTGVPTSFVLDGEGGIRFVSVGYTSEVGLRARLWLARQ